MRHVLDFVVRYRNSRLEEKFVLDGISIRFEDISVREVTR